MKTITLLLLWIVVAAHAGFAFIEMYPCDRPKVFEKVDLKFVPKDFNEEKAAPIVWNAGLYNFFLASGLVWGIRSQKNAFSLRIFFLTCAMVAGIFGYFTLTPTTLVLQTIPAALALAAVWRTR